MQAVVAGKKAEESPDKDGRNTSPILLVQLQQQAEWRRKCINFAETSGQRRPDEDTICSEMKICNTGLSQQIYQFYLVTMSIHGSYSA